METQNDAAASAAADAVVHPTDPPQPIEPVPQPQADLGDPSVEEIETLRANALDDDPEFAEIIDVRESALEEIVNPDVIHPTVGRKVWFRKHGADINGQPEDATIVYVHSDHMVNLFVVSPNGEPRGECSIPLVHEGEERPEEGYFAEWMPFQKGQARSQSMQAIPLERIVGLGDDVYYGNGNGEIHAAKVVGNADFASVDLVVFERERVHHVFKVAKADITENNLNGWAFKA